MYLPSLLLALFLSVGAWISPPPTTTTRHRSSRSLIYSSVSDNNPKDTTTTTTDSTPFDRNKHVSILDKSLRNVSNCGLLEHIYGEEHFQDRHAWDDVHMSMRFALLSHGAVNGWDGPIHNYANFGACSAFQANQTALLDLPASRVAKSGIDQESWSMMLERLKDEPNGFLDSYQGYRCSTMSSQRFYIRDAMVWNCYDDNGDYYGQAILFDREKVSFPETPY